MPIHDEEITSKGAKKKEAERFAARVYQDHPPAKAACPIFPLRFIVRERANGGDEIVSGPGLQL